MAITHFNKESKFLDQKFIKEAFVIFDKLMHQDKRKLLTALMNLSYINDERVFNEKKEEFVDACAVALSKVEARIRNVPKLNYNEDLPVTQKKDEIVKAIKENQVIILAGETGSGKTTQLPKMCLEAGLGIKGFIGHTQPRRIAARAVANRIAEELHESLGQSVGFKIRFHEECSENSYIKLMTDGILLSESATDRQFLDYDCIIIDEAHERSLNIDFLLGYLKKLLKKRPDLKLIITSATIDPERFSKHFNNAPIIEVSGRTYPVDVVYLPLDTVDEDGDLVFESGDLNEGILKAFNYLMECGRGDVLVFLPGERDIMEMSHFLKKANLRDVEILPLYARLTTVEQNKIFTEHTGVRIVLATNVAETSLTVPSIKYVIDPGFARISRYSVRSKVQRLPVEPISQASANQRKGRCGRVSNGICVRLYSEDDFNSRPMYTDPEILRSNLASVILQMVSLKLGDIRDFPFIDPPTDRQITDGMRLLEEIGAIAKSKDNDVGSLTLTTIGRNISMLPLDPRLARMIVESVKYQCLSQLLIITSFLAVMDPRESPLDKREASRQYHARFDDDKSDFIAILKLYDYLTTLQKENSSSAYKRILKKEYLSYLRVREWFDVHRQLKSFCLALKFRLNETEATYEQIHRSVLSGLLSQIGFKDSNEKGTYLGARGIKFLIHPQSKLSKKMPQWICAAELSETSKLFARTVATIDPTWCEYVGEHLIKKHYSDPHWSKNSGAVKAKLSLSLYGLYIIRDRNVLYSNIDPKLCRELLIKEGLVLGEINLNYPFYKENLRLIDDVSYLEDKLRRRDILVDESTLIEFYDSKIPDGIVTTKHFDKWWSKKSKEDPNYLDLSFDLIAKNQDAVKDIDDLYPEKWIADDYFVKLSYIFDPTNKDDGVSAHVPITIINKLKKDDFLWQVKGLREELYSSLIKSLPKKLRRNLIPAPFFAKALNEAIVPFSGNVYELCAKALTKMGGELVKVEDFNLKEIDKHLFITFVIEDENGKCIEKGKDLSALQDRLSHKSREAIKKVVSNKKIVESKETWSFGSIKKEEIKKMGALEIVAYPALVDKVNKVSLELFDNKSMQDRAMWQGQRRLLSLSIKDPTSYLENHLPNKAKLSMYYQALGSVKDLINDFILASIDKIMLDNGGVVWDESSFNNLREKVRANLNDTALQIANYTEKALIKAHELKRMLKGQLSFEVAKCYAAVDQSLDNLIYKGFVTETTLEHLKDLPRYLQAYIERLKKVSRDVNRDAQYQRFLDEVNNRYRGAITRYNKDNLPNDLKNVKWMIEELSVSYFAQQLGVNGPISDKRIFNEIDRILKEYPPLR